MATRWSYFDQDNIFEKMDTVVDSISKKYKRKKLTIHADPDLITMYGRAYRAKYPNTKNEDGENMRVDFSKLLLLLWMV